jgi:hypothetical protein
MTPWNPRPFVTPETSIRWFSVKTLSIVRTSPALSSPRSFASCTRISLRCRKTPVPAFLNTPTSGFESRRACFSSIAPNPSTTAS